MKLLSTWLLFVGSALAQQPEPTLDQLIQQLAAPRVRLRDEAQQALAQRLDAGPTLRAALETTPSEEARLRLKRILKGFHDGQWMIEWQQTEPVGGIDRGAMRATADGKQLADVHSEGIDILETDTFTPLRRQGGVTPRIDTRTAAPSPFLRWLAFSRDGKRLAYLKENRNIIIEDDLGERLRVLLPETRKEIKIVNGVRTESNPAITSVAAEFLPGTESLLVLSGSGLALHEVFGEAKRMSYKELLPAGVKNVVAQSMALSGDGRMVGVAFVVPGPDDDLVAMVKLPEMTVAWRCAISVTPRMIAVNHDGSEALVAQRERGLVRCSASTPAADTVSRGIDGLTSVAYAADGRSAFLTSSRRFTPVRQIALPSGDELWTSPALATGCHHLTLVGADRIAAKTDDNLIVVWKKRTPAPSP